MTECVPNGLFLVMEGILSLRSEHPFTAGQTGQDCIYKPL